MGDLVISLLITISAFLDTLLAWVIEQAYNLLMLIADTNIFGDDAIKVFSGRIYVLLGVFMLFKLSFSLVNFLIDPDAFYSKDTGGKKLITNVVVVLLLIVATPFLFAQAYNLQGILLSNHVIDRVILGVDQTLPTTSGDEVDESNKFSRTLSFSVFSSFYMPNKDIPSVYSACENMYSTSDVSDCATEVARVSGDPESKADLEAAFSNKKVSKLFAHSLLHAKAEGIYVFDYKFFISTITGVIVALILVGFCIDVALRAVKLGFLQLIAPIPIISYLDPKSSKSGMFKNWVTNVMKTFLDLFIRLAAVFFAVFIISLLSNNEMESISGGNPILFSEHPFVKIFIILGALLFAKQVPSLISDISGMKFDGGFSLNPMRKVNQAPLIGKTAAGLGGAVAGMVAGQRVGNIGLGAMVGAKSGFKSVPMGGSKDGAPTFGTGANAAYKEIMGTDFVTLSPEKMLMSMAADKKISEISQPMGRAYNKQNQLNTELNQASHVTVGEASNLRSKGVNLKDLANEKTRLSTQNQNLMQKANSAKTNRDNAMSRMTSMSESYENAKSRLSSGLLQPGDVAYSENQKTIMDYEKNFPEIQKEATEFSTQYDSIVKDINTNNNLIESIDKYQFSVEDENRIRKEMAGVQKDINTLSSEKKQREKFYHYDPSPTEDVKKVKSKYTEPTEGPSSGPGSGM